MLNLEKESPAKLFLGEGSLTKILQMNFQGQGLLVTTSGLVRRGQIHGFTEALKKENRPFEILYSEPNPSLSHLEEQIGKLKDISWVIAIGGGSTLDSGKVIASMLSHENHGKSLSEIARNETILEASRLPLFSVPTTAGTGAEVTPFATVWDTKAMKKLSFSQKAFVPDAVVLDPNLVKTAPRNLAVNCALDTCSHALESLWNKNATEKSASYANEALSGFLQAFPKILSAPDFSESMALMQRASFWGGMAISLTRTAIAHAISYPVTLHYGAPHGLACSFLLPQIADLVTKEGKWYSGANQEYVEATLRLLKKANLPERIARYASKEEIASLKNEMFTRGRSENFVLGSNAVEALFCASKT